MVWIFLMLFPQLMLIGNSRDISAVEYFEIVGWESIVVILLFLLVGFSLAFSLYKIGRAMNTGEYSPIGRKI